MVPRLQRTTFGQRRAVGLACIVARDAELNGTFAGLLASAGFLTRELASAAQFVASDLLPDADIVAFDLASLGQDPMEIMRALAASGFPGDLILIGRFDAEASAALAQIAAEQGLSMLPPLSKPLRPSELEDRLALLQPVASRAAPGIDLEQALHHDWLELWYQPKMELQCSTLCGAEALLRMRHPVRGVVMPAEFLPARDDDRMLAVSQFVVTRAMADWLAFAETRLPIELSINVPLRTFRDARFLRFLHNRLPIHPHFPGLVLEIDAAELAAERDTICALAAELAMFRVRLSVDDLGCCTFWSGLPVFPFAELKVDQQFVSGCAGDRLKRALCQTIVDIGHRFGARIVAEGVDIQEDLVAVRDMGFDMAQGFLLGTPLQPAAFTRAMLRRTFALH